MQHLRGCNYHPPPTQVTRVALTLSEAITHNLPFCEEAPFAPLPGCCAGGAAASSSPAKPPSSAPPSSCSPREGLLNHALAYAQWSEDGLAAACVGQCAEGLAVLHADCVPAEAVAAWLDSLLGRARTLHVFLENSFDNPGVLALLHERGVPTQVVDTSAQDILDGARGMDRVVLVSGLREAGRAASGAVAESLALAVRFWRGR